MSHPKFAKALSIDQPACRPLSVFKFQLSDSFLSADIDEFPVSIRHNLQIMAHVAQPVHDFIIPGAAGIFRRNVSTDPDAAPFPVLIPSSVQESGSAQCR